MNIDTSGRPSDDDDDSGNTSEEEDGYGNDSNAGHPMMSIFASYYGIQDPADTAGQNKPKGTIDDADFDAEGYVKKLLESERVESLILRDTELVHEIRTLDGEMQKLVYDNYNKFITATETIKEMKNDVYGMDADMEAVRTKMQQIAEGAATLDVKLQPTREKVDKLVRVQRLLERLEFLSELPERLAAMIDAKQYREAVRLYHKTISVLTRHSHVLSFKNIKERTELMMRDMTGKVIDLLEEPSLDAVKLTQYVSVLRLMNAPRAKVAQKLLTAHRSRSMRMIQNFQASLSAGTSAIAAATAASDVDVESRKGCSISAAREFHQSLIVGLIEACKGIYELYHAERDESGASPSAPAGGSDPSGQDKEYADAYNTLKSMLSDVMREYTSGILSAFGMFFRRFEDNFVGVVVEYADLDDIDAQYLRDIKRVLAGSRDGDVMEGTGAGGGGGGGGSGGGGGGGSGGGGSGDGGKAKRRHDKKRRTGKKGRGHRSRLGSSEDEHDSRSDDDSGPYDSHSRDDDDSDDDDSDDNGKDGSDEDDDGRASDNDDKEAAHAARAVFEDTAEATTTAETQAKTFATAELRQEKNSWLLLARQAIIDVQFLDSNQKNCLDKVAPLYAAEAASSIVSSGTPGSASRGGAATATTPGAGGGKRSLLQLVSPAAAAAQAAYTATVTVGGMLSPSQRMQTHNAYPMLEDGTVEMDRLRQHQEEQQQQHASMFAQLLLAALQQHCDLLLAHRICCYHSAVYKCLPAALILCDVKHSSINANNGTASSRLTGRPTSGGYSGGSAGSTMMTMAASDSSHGGGGSSHGVSAAVEAQRDRTALQRHMVLMEQLLGLLQRGAVQCFVETAKDIKPLADMCEVSQGDVDAIVIPMVSRYHNMLAYGAELVSGVRNDKCSYDPVTDQVVFAQVRTDENTEGDVGIEDSDEIYTELGSAMNLAAAAAAAPITPGSGYSPAPSRSGSQKRGVDSTPGGICGGGGGGGGSGGEIAPLSTAELFAHLSHLPQTSLSADVDKDTEAFGAADPFTSYTKLLAAPSSHSASLPRGCSPQYQSHCVAGIRHPLALLMNAVLRRLIPTLMSQLQEQLQRLDLPPLEGHMSFQDQCHERLVLTAQLLLQQATEANALLASDLFVAAQQQSYLMHYTAATAPDSSMEQAAQAALSATHTVSDAMLELSQLLDGLALTSCVLFAETPPQLKNVLGADRGAGGESGMGSTSGMSGGGLSGGVGVRGQRRSVAQRGTVSAIEMDIERLFSKRVQIFSAVSFNDAADVLLGTVLKASFKASIEAVRVMTLPFPAYIQIQANITFLKQVAAGLLKDGGQECLALVDQNLNAIFARYLGANDISSASDSQELALVSRAVGAAFSSLVPTTVLITRTS